MMRLEVERSVVDPRVRRYVLATRVVWQNEVENADVLLQEKGPACTIKRTGESIPGIVLDFGREIHGGVQLDNGITVNHKPTRVRVRFGESVSEVMGEPNQDHAIHDQETLVPWYGTAEIGNTGFRFVRIDVVDPENELVLNHVRAVFIYRDIEYKGQFRCNDDRLNRIWQTGAYTTHLCMQDRLWDGIKRDRLVWIGDMHPETTVISHVFGDQDVVPKSLDYVRDNTPLPGWMNGISSYSLWWVLIQHSWYVFHGNAEYLAQQKPYLLGLLEILRGEIDENGREKMSGHRFLDWPSSEAETAIHVGLHSLLTMTLKAGAELCGWLNEPNAQQQCTAAVEQLHRYTPPSTPSKQASALVALAGLAKADEMNRSVLAVDPFHGLSTFYGFYVLQARALAGDYQGCLDVIRTYWGAMLDLGATTFWEDFDLNWTQNAAGIDAPVPEGKKDIHGDFGNYCYKGLRHSLCHGWASGPTAWLSEHVLGFRPLEPGCKRLLVKPNLGDLEFAEGAFPTPAGVVTVRHERAADGSVKSDVEAPEGIRIEKE